jgi:hypothetical protein
MNPGQPLFGIHLKSAVRCVEVECSTVFDGGAARTSFIAEKDRAT